MPYLKVKTLFVLTAFFITVQNSPVSAGFEFTPTNTPTPVQAPQQQNINPYSNPQGFPAGAVMAEPLDIRPQYTGPYGSDMGSNIHPRSPAPLPEPMPPSDNIMAQYGASSVQPPPSQPRRVPQQKQIQNLSGNSLVIDPYPLRNMNTIATPVNLSEGSVNQAMAEEAKILNPLKLGAGLQTGAQPIQERLAAARKADYKNTIPGVNGNQGGLTPMMGGEPAPLPGMSPQRSSNGMSNRNYANAVGFGRDLPLALALSQVIPEGFTPSYANSVDTSKSVSWEGGKPWNEVLNDMLRSQNLTATIQGNQVVISNLGRG